jgi:hypothetical protein
MPLSLGKAFNTMMNIHDVTFTYRLLSGLQVPVQVDYIGTPPGLPGDYNGDMVVDAADYIIWRKNETANNPLPNDNGLTTQADRYDLWRDNFGNTPGSGSSLGGEAVPEPGALGLWLCAGVLLAARRRSIISR